MPADPLVPTPGAGDRVEGLPCAHVGRHVEASLLLADDLLERAACTQRLARVKVKVKVRVRESLVGVGSELGEGQS